MRPIRQASCHAEPCQAGSYHAAPFVMALVLSVGGSFACWSSSTKAPADGGGGAAGAAGLGGAAGQVDAGADAPADAAVADSGRPDIPLADGSGPDSAASMAVTSASLTEGAPFLVENTCAGVNTSPALTWTSGPTGTMSYSVALTDLSNGAVHWILWDIPGGTTSLPPVLPGDTTLTTPVSAQQLHRAAFFGAGGAYRGPCPSGNLHLYQFQVNAIGTATLAGVTGASTTEQIQALAQVASLAHGNLSGTSNATAAPVDASGQ